jgi:ankyrin repeat protein
MLWIGLASAASAQYCNDRLTMAVNEERVTDAAAAVRSGCDVNHPLDGSGATPLMWAKSPAMVRALLAEGARVDARDEYGRTAAAHAAARGDLDSLRLLVGRGAAVDTPPGSVCGPLCEAIWQPKNRNDVVRELVRAGASIDGMDCWGRTALFTAGAVGDPDVVRLVLSLGGNPNRYETYGGNTLLMQATLTGNLGSVDALLKANASPAWPNQGSCQTPLHVAAARGNAAVARRLVESGAPLSDTDSKGKTALDIARQSGNAAVAQLLSSAGATQGGSPRTGCVNSTDAPEAYEAWQSARRQTRLPACRSIVERTMNAPATGGGTR